MEKLARMPPTSLNFESNDFNMRIKETACADNSESSSWLVCYFYFYLIT